MRINNNSHVLVIEPRVQVLGWEAQMEHMMDSALYGRIIRTPSGAVIKCVNISISCLGGFVFVKVARPIHVRVKMVSPQPVLNVQKMERKYVQVVMIILH